MQAFVRFVLILVFSALSASAWAETRQEILSALEHYEDMWNEGDFDAIRSYYHSDFVLINEDGPVPANQRLEDLKVIMTSDGDAGQLVYSDVQVKELEDKHAVAYGKYDITFKDESSLSGWFTTVYVNTPFGWKATLTRN